MTWLRQVRPLRRTNTNSTERLNVSAANYIGLGTINRQRSKPTSESSSRLRLCRESMTTVIL